MLDFFPGNLSEALSRNTTTKSLCLGITLSEIDSVKVVLLVQTCFDEGFDSTNRGRGQAIEFLDKMFVNGRVEFFRRLRRDDLAESFSKRSRKSLIRKHILDKSTLQHFRCGNLLVEDQDFVCLGDSH
jgi:hypothetical protein